MSRETGYGVILTVTDALVFELNNYKHWPQSENESLISVTTSDCRHLRVKYYHLKLIITQSQRNIIILNTRN